MPNNDTKNIVIGFYTSIPVFFTCVSIIPNIGNFDSSIPDITASLFVYLFQHNKKSLLNVRNSIPQLISVFSRYEINCPCCNEAVFIFSSRNSSSQKLSSVSES